MPLCVSVQCTSNFSIFGVEFTVQLLSLGSNSASKFCVIKKVKSKFWRLVTFVYRTPVRYTNYE